MQKPIGKFWRYICAVDVTIGGMMREVAGRAVWGDTFVTDRSGGIVDRGRIFSLEIDIVPAGAEFVRNELYSKDVISSMDEVE